MKPRFKNAKMGLISVMFFIVPFILSSCSSNDDLTAGTGRFGILITNVKGPHKFPPNKDVMANRTGKACAHSILGLFAFGDATIREAKREGHISRIAAIDRSVMYITSSLYTQYCTIVSGE